MGGAAAEGRAALILLLVVKAGCLEAPPIAGSDAAIDRDATIGSDGPELACSGGRIDAFDEDFFTLSEWSVETAAGCTVSLTSNDLLINQTGTDPCGVSSLASFDADNQTVWLLLEDSNTNQGDPDLHFRLEAGSQRFADVQRIGGSVLFYVCAGDLCQSGSLSGTGRYLALHLDSGAGEIWADMSDSAVFEPDTIFSDPGLAGTCVSLRIATLVNPSGEDVPILVEGINQPD